MPVTCNGNKLTVTFSALGTPQPQGSTRAFVVGGKPRITSDNPKLADWRRNIRLSAHAAWNRDATVGAVYVFAGFVFARPRNHFGTGRNAHVIKPACVDAIPPIDLDKLVRALLDGMTGVVYRDDRQVTFIDAGKRYVCGGEHPGVEVLVEVEN